MFILLTISVIYHSYSCSDDTDQPDDEDQPVYEFPPPKYSADYILKVLLDPDIDKRKICTSKPTNVTRSATYIVNIQSLKHADDIKKDQFLSIQWQLRVGSNPLQIFSYNIAMKNDLFIEVVRMCTTCQNEQGSVKK